MWLTSPTREVGLQLTNKALCLSWATFRKFIDSMSLLFMISPRWFIEALAFQQLEKKRKDGNGEASKYPDNDFCFLSSFIPSPSFSSSLPSFLPFFIFEKVWLTYLLQSSLGNEQGCQWYFLANWTWSLALILLPHQQSTGLTFSPWRGDQQVPAARLKDGNTPIRVSA